MTNLRVASYNVRYFRDDKAALARVVRALDPDVLCLQEVPRRILARTRIGSFARDCGMYWSGAHQGSGGTTMLTSLRVRLAQVHHRPLPVVPRTERRGFTMAMVTAPGSAPVVVAGVHLSLDRDERVRHVQLIHDAAPPGLAFILAGDLNEQSDGAAWSWLAQRLTWVSDPANTFPARAPRKTIDAVFASPWLPVTPPEPVDLDVDDLRVATDHRPVWCDVELPAARAQGR